MKPKCHWLNADFSKSPSIIVRKDFIYLISKHFLRTHKLYKIFNRDGEGLEGQSHTKNILSIIRGHNKKVIANLLYKVSSYRHHQLKMALVEH